VIVEALDARRDSRVTESELAERVIVQARATEGDDYAISFRALQLWRTVYTSRGADGQIRGVEALIDQRGSGIFNWGEHSGRSPEAVEYFYSLFHAQSGPTIRTCHEATVRTATQNKWTWPSSYPATCKWLNTHDDMALTCLMREGREAWQHRYMPHNEIDHAQIEPGDLFVCDHTQVDFWVEYRGQQLRPWLTAIQDDRSRCIVGWNLGIAPHQDAILAGMRRAFRDHAIPRNMRIDNGKDFTSKLLTGVTKHTRDRLKAELGPQWREAMRRGESLIECVDPRFGGIINELGVELIYAIPYAPWSKGTLERFFGTFETQCGKTFATYCGNSTLSRPECLEAIRRGYTKQQKRYLRKKYGKAWKKIAILKIVDQSAVPTLQEAREAIGEWIDVYHRTEHRGQGMNGAAPHAAWLTARSLRKADTNALAFLMESRGVYKVGANGVTFKVGSANLTYGGSEPKLYPLRGREVFVTLDPDRPAECFAYTADEANRKFVARLECNQRISPLASIDAVREANATINRRRKMYRQADSEAATRMRNVAQELRAQQRSKLNELQATGTDGAPRAVNVEPVRTRFDGHSKVTHTATVDRPVRDLAGTWAAIRYGSPNERRPVETEKQLTLADLSRGIAPDVSDTDADDITEGTEADRTPTDLLGLIAGNRHGRNG